MARFEQKGLIAFESLIKLAIALGYALPDIRTLFGTSRFDTMEELDMIRAVKAVAQEHTLKTRKDDEKTEKLKVMFSRAGCRHIVAYADNRMNVFEYDKSWLANGFSISPLEPPLKALGVFIAKPQPFYGNFGVFEDSLPDGYGRYLLHKTLLRKGINDSALSSLDRSPLWAITVWAHSPTHLGRSTLSRKKT